MIEGRAASRTSSRSVRKEVSSRLISTGFVKLRNVFTARSSRSISLSSIFTACCGSGSMGILAFSTSSHKRMELSGFFTSCATPAVTRPRAARRSETCSWLPMRSIDSTSRRVTSVPIRAPCSRITCTLTPMRCGPSLP